MINTINTLFGTDFSGAAMLGALIGGIFLLFLLLWLLGRMIRRPGFGFQRAAKARLAITDIAKIDERRRLLLVKRDDVEHLILIGGGNDLVVEKDIHKQQKQTAKPDTQAPKPGATIAEQKAAKLPKAKEPFFQESKPAAKPAPTAVEKEAPAAKNTDKNPKVEKKEAPIRSSAVDEMNALLGDVRPKR